MNKDAHRWILRDDRIIETITKLRHRISDRFPESGLAGLCGQLLEVAQKASQRSAWINRPIRSIRVAGYLLAALLLFLFIAAIVYELQPSQAAEGAAAEVEKFGVFDLVQAFDSGANAIIALSIAIFFLVSLETRIKRRRALAAIHELRSIAHIIDMHQLTKDPERFLRSWIDTEHSPKQKMTPMQLNRYLDYCSEMLSLTGKIAALYVQQFNDADAVAAVSEVEQLTTGLSRKIWQKIMILQKSLEMLPESSTTTAAAATVATPPAGPAPLAASTAASSGPSELS